MANIGNENQVQESFDGEEIMVGSDVFVDGVSGDKDDAEDKPEESELGPSAPRGEQNFVVSEELVGSVSQSVYGAVTEPEEVMGMDLDDVLDFRAVYDDDDDDAETNTDKGINVETREDIGETLPHTTGSCSLGGKEFGQADSSTYDVPLVAAIASAQVGAMGSAAQGDGITEIAVASLKCQEIAKSPALDVSTGYMSLPANSVCSNVQMLDVIMAENHVTCYNPVINVEGRHTKLAEECLHSPSKEQLVLLQKTEKTIDRVHSTELLTSSTNGSLVGGCVSEETCISDMDTSKDEVNKSREAEDNSSKTNDNLITETHAPEIKSMDVEEEFTHRKEDEYEVREIELKESASGADRLNMSKEEPVKSTRSVRMNQSCYLAPPDNDGQFALSDLVWGKVRSHPWWPGQIFDPSDASEKAVKYHKKDSYLIAYFGDRTFAWNDASLLKPFRSHFPQIEKQSSSEAFQNAVTCALEEVSRRVELGLACSCIPKDAYHDIESQVVENTGIREESSRRYGVDQSSRAGSFEPHKLLEYVRDLAPNAFSGADRLDLVIARAQLSAFCRFKGYRLPSEISLSAELLGNDANAAQISSEMVASHKRKHIPKDCLQSRKRDRSLTELMGEDQLAEDESGAKDLSRSSGKKRKALCSLADGSDKGLKSYAAKVSTSTNPTPKPSFKIGECIRRVASQLTGSASMVKGHNDEMGVNGSPKTDLHDGRQSMVVSAGSFSPNEMLSHLQLVAQDPKKGHDYIKTTATFFSDFRSSVAVNKRSRKKKSVKNTNGCAEEFDFDDVNDSYWTDRIVQNYSEEQLLHNSDNGTGDPQLQPFDAGKSVKSSGQKSHSGKRYLKENNPKMASVQSDEDVKRRKQEASPAELILNFTEKTYIPSEINLNKMFRRFGPLMESETEVDHDCGRAKVIFKRGADAEVAHNSAKKFNIFGPVLVSYQIGYSPLISVKISPLAVPQFQEDVALML